MPGEALRSTIESVLGLMRRRRRIAPARHRGAQEAGEPPLQLRRIAEGRLQRTEPVLENRDAKIVIAKDDEFRRLHAGIEQWRYSL